MSKYVLASAIFLLSACTGETKPASTSDSTVVVTDSVVVKDTLSDTTLRGTTLIADTVKR